MFVYVHILFVKRDENTITKTITIIVGIKEENCMLIIICELFMSKCVEIDIYFNMPNYTKYIQRNFTRGLCIYTL